jgi:zeaxanthin glucosyltransferase
MSHIGLVAPAYIGHVNPMITLGNELQRRGHQVSLISMPDAEEMTVRSNIPFIAIGADKFPVGTLGTFVDKQGTLTGVPAIRYIIKDLTKIAVAHAAELREVIRDNGIDALVLDQILPMATVVADSLDVPYVTLCSLLPLNEDKSIPPFNMAWPYSQATQARIQYAIGYRVQALVERPLTVLCNAQRVKWGMKPTTVDGTFSKLAQIAQIPAAIDFPRKNAPDCFHNTSPLVDFESSDPIAFPWERLDGRPLIYATMGTLQNGIKGIFHTIAAACDGLDAQVVIALGRKGAPIPTNLPGDPIVVDYAPQVDLLKRASLLVCHGGLNTVLHGLSVGIPMVLMPAATDQPGVGARVKHLGAAETIPVRRANPRKLRAAIETVQSNPSYRANARKIQDSLKELAGVSHTADIVEQAFSTRRPVLRTAVPV